MSSAIDFAAVCYKNDHAGRQEISTDTAQNNQVKCLEKQIPRGWDLGDSWGKAPLQSTVPCRGKAPRSRVVAELCKLEVWHLLETSEQEDLKPALGSPVVTIAKSISFLRNTTLR